MDKPNHHDVEVILKLYELRREDRMRKAREWLLSFVTSGAVNKELFLQSGGEMLFVWEKIKGNVARSREAMGNPNYLSNLETVAQALIENMNKANPKAYDIFSARVRGVGA
ncbi:MAG: hypothetical protein ABSH31_24395 [Bryobacteraceae bacterium]